jgi:Family of unknown function (DUF6885)
MASAQELTTTLLPGAAELLAAHSRWLPQRDDLCGAFCGALALAAAGIDRPAGETIDQDAVALAAGSVIAGAREEGTLPHGEAGRRDYRLALPQVADPAVSGTTAAGVVAALPRLSGGDLDAVPLSGPWTESTLAALFDACAALEGPVTLIANHATRYLWGGGASIAQLLGVLLRGEDHGPPPDWDVGHFACVVGRVQGPRGCLYGIADTYPSLGSRGLHMQPAARLAAALERRDVPAGGMIVVVRAQDAERLRTDAFSAGLAERLWDNGTVSPGAIA